MRVPASCIQEAAKGDTLTGVVENGKKIEVWFWGNYNPASRDVIALYVARSP